MSYNLFLQDDAQVMNHEGARVYSMSPELELYSLVCTMALQPKFYESPADQVERLSRLVAKVSPEFVARLAIYARREMHLRSVPLLLAVELVRVHSGDSLVSRTIGQVVMRADEIAELLMCYQWRNPQEGRKKLGRLSHQVQTGLAVAFNKFDEYQFAKYDRDGRAVKLRDALFLVHPKPKDDAQQAVFNKIATGTLAVPYTWETELSAVGQLHYESSEARQQAFASKWQELVDSGKLGYMALLRNLRNLLNCGLDESTLQDVAERIGNPREVVRAKQLPFRYLAAYKELRGVDQPSTPMMLNALEQAIEASAARIAGFDRSTRVLLACDMSGSMQYPLTRNSSICNYEVGIVLAMMLQGKASQVVTGIFADEWKVINLPQGNILASSDEIARHVGEVGYGTEGEKPLLWLIGQRMAMDKVMLFTDCEFWDIDGGFRHLWQQYKQIAPLAHLYIFDLAGYGHSPINMPRPDVTLISGWSDRIFDMLDALEHGSDVVSEISKIEL